MTDHVIEIYENDTSYAMSDAFYEWLNQCPTVWHRQAIGSDGATYFFDADNVCPECGELGHKDQPENCSFCNDNTDI